ncbi:hypothetical protein EV424DRAFT_1439386, partial [Suillus variegatus]
VGLIWTFVMNIGECASFSIFLTCPCSGSVGRATFDRLMQILEQNTIFESTGRKPQRPVRYQPVSLPSLWDSWQRLPASRP